MSQNPDADGETRHEVRFVEVDQSSDGQRIDNFLLKVFGRVPKSHVYRLLRTGQVRVNKGRKKPTYKLQLHDVVRLPPIKLPDEKNIVVPQSVVDRVAKDIVFEDEQLIAVNKKQGLAVHAGSGVLYGLIDAIRQSREEKGLELVHRLDRATSGCLLLAKNRKSLLRLQNAFRENQVSKQYLALTAGHWSESTQSCRLPLKKNTIRGGERMVIVADDGKHAVSHFTVVKQFKDCALVSVKIETGRTHQIRVHAASLGHPVIGDEKYGEEALNATMKKKGLKRMYLHAQHLSLLQESGYEFYAPLDKQWQSDMALLS